MTETDTLIAALRALPSGRKLVAVAGAPGSGKSTLAEMLGDALNAERAGRAAVVPMDGFHYDDAVLKEMGLLPRKGAPATFDVGGLDALLGRLKANAEPWVTVPLFDRELEISRAGARRVMPETEVLIVEGNYLLLAIPPWDRLARHFDMTVMLDVPRPVLEARLVARWQGFGYAPEAIRAKLAENDLPNGDTVRHDSRAADFVIRDQAADQSA